MKMLPKYPVYVPSKGRFKWNLTPKFLIKDGVPFFLVVEPSERASYEKQLESPYVTILELPWDGASEKRATFCRRLNIENGGLIAARNWIRQHSVSIGAERHWQLDDNIRQISRRIKGKRVPCEAGIALRTCEIFADRYENVGIAGLNYEMFIPDKTSQRFPPFYLNHRVYSCSLILNRLPCTWRLTYNDDTDLCLQCLTAGFCTVNLNAFLIRKQRTMMLQGGNTSIYVADGRLRMARSLERMWPGVVTTHRRFQRPQHRVNSEWTKFDVPLRKKRGAHHERIPDLKLERTGAVPANMQSVYERLV